MSSLFNDELKVKSHQNQYDVFSFHFETLISSKLNVEYASYTVDATSGAVMVDQVIAESDGDGGLEDAGRPNEYFF